MQTSDRHVRKSRSIDIRFYAELNDFLPSAISHRVFSRQFVGTPSVKDTIEAIGVPHTEVDVILVDGRSVDFSQRLYGGERLAVFPVFERFDVSPLTRLRPRPLRVTRFVADVHLGALARNLRLLGFDTTWHRNLADEDIVDIAEREKRIILTRDKGLLKVGRVTHGYWLRATDPTEQFEEVVRALDLGNAIKPYTRCMRCNAVIESVKRSDVAQSVPLQVFLVYRDFKRCPGCRRIYWSGSHLRRLDKLVARARSASCSNQLAVQK